MKVSPIILSGSLATIVFICFCIFLGLQNVCSSTLSREICQTNFSAFLTSPPNEKGDTLAGLAGSLAFLWIIVTVALQSQELKAQRNELELTRNEMKVGNDSFSKQIYETSFFSMLQTYNSIVEAIDVTISNQSIISIANGQPDIIETLSGRDAFSKFLERYKRQYDWKIKEYEKNEIPINQLDIITKSYEEFWEEHKTELGHYFRFLYRFFLVIKNSEHSEVRHAKILRGFLSDQELALLFYNCLFRHGEKFKHLAIEFSIFDNLPKELLANEEHIALLPVQAFNSQPLLMEVKS